MATDHRYQVMPDLPPAQRAALKADIAANGVRVPIEVDEEGNILDGHQRQQICDELARECPKRVLVGLTEEQKLEHACLVNLTRRHLSKAQKRQIASTLWDKGWTQDHIAQAVGVSQRTISNWSREVSNSAKLPHSLTVQGKDGKQYPRKKTRRRTTHPTEDASIPETPQIPSDTGDRSAPALERQGMPKPQDTHTEAQLPSSEPPGASDVPNAPESPSPVGDEWHPVLGEQAISPLGSNPIPPAEDDAEARWVDALQDLAVNLETLHVQAGSLPPSKYWAPETTARGVDAIQCIKARLTTLEAVVASDKGEARGRNGQDNVDITTPQAVAPAADEVQEHGKRELVPVSPTEDRVGGMADGNQLPIPGDSEGKPSRDQVLPIQEEEKPSTQGPPPAPAMPAQARSRTRRSNAKDLAASTMEELTKPAPDASATLAEISGSTDDAAPPERCSPDVPSNNRAPDHDRPEPSSGSQEVCPDESSPLNSSKPKANAGTGGLATTHGPASAGGAPLPLCPKCGSSITWAPTTANGYRPGRFACMACQHHFDTLKPGDEPSTQSQVSFHKITQVVSEEQPEDSRVKDQQQSPLAPAPVTDPLTQDGIDPGPREATVDSTVGGGPFDDENTAQQAPPVGPRDEGETHQSERREIA